MFNFCRVFVKQMKSVGFKFIIIKTGCIKSPQNYYGN